MRRSMLSLSLSRSEAGVTRGDSSDTEGRPLTCTEGRDGVAMMRSSNLRWVLMFPRFSIKEERVGRPAAPKFRERRMSAIGGKEVGDGVVKNRVRRRGGCERC